MSESTVPSHLTASKRPSPPAQAVRPRKTHPCPHCDRFFTCPHNVQQHIRERHTNSRPYRCEICAASGKESAFNRPWVLYRHLKDLHGVLADRGTRRSSSHDQPTQETSVTQDESPTQEGSPPSAPVTSSSTPTPTPTPTPAPEPPIDPMMTTQSNEALHNFLDENVCCLLCGAIFPNREVVIMHCHDGHGQSASAMCNCMMCTTKFGGNPDIHQKLVSGGFGIAQPAPSPMGAPLPMVDDASDVEFLDTSPNGLEAMMDGFDAMNPDDLFPMEPGSFDEDGGDDMLLDSVQDDFSQSVDMHEASSVDFIPDALVAGDCLDSSYEPYMGNLGDFGGMQDLFSMSTEGPYASGYDILPYEDFGWST